MFAITLLLDVCIIVIGFIVCIAARTALIRNEEQADWRLPRGRHHRLRRSFVRKILDMLRAKHPGPDGERRLPRIAKSLEYRLFRKASSLQEYQDKKTFKPRLKTIVREVYEAAGRPFPAADEAMAPEAAENDTFDSDRDKPEIDPQREPLVGTYQMVVPRQDNHTPRVLEIETAVEFDLEDQTTKVVGVVVE